MQNSHSDLGEMRSVHRPSKPTILPILGLSIPLLMLAALCTLLIVDSFTGVLTKGKGVTFETVSNYVICSGVTGLLLALLGSLLISDFRSWSGTRTVKLTIYQEGFTYESQGRIEACRWDEIEKIKFGFIEVHSKAFRARERVIRSIVKRGGAAINLAETLELRRITGLITAAMKKAC